MTRSLAEHGTTARYRSGCRCLRCKWANTDYCREYRRERQRRLEAGEVEIQHGTTDSYRNWGCCCDACRAAAYRQKTDARARREYEASFPRVLHARLLAGYLPLHPVRTANLTIFLPPTTGEIERCQDVLLSMLGLTDAFTPYVEWSVRPMPSS